MSGSDLDPVARRTGRLTRIVSGLGVVIPLPLTLLSQRLVRQEPTFESLLPALLATFPDATVAFTHRDPVAVIQSAITMMAYSDRLRRRSIAFVLGLR